MPAEPDDLLLVGRVMRAHGVVGELRVFPITDEPERLGALPQVFVGRDQAQAKPFAVAQGRLHQTKQGTLVVLKLAGVATREAADALRHFDIFAREGDLPPLADEEVYLHDLIGLRVETDTGDPVGTLTDILDLPGHDVYVVDRDGAEVLIPAVPDFITEIDLDAERVVVRPIEGLLD